MFCQMTCITSLAFVTWLAVLNKTTAYLLRCIFLKNLNGKTSKTMRGKIITNDEQNWFECDEFVMD